MSLEKRVGSKERSGEMMGISNLLQHDEAGNTELSEVLAGREV